MNNEFQPIDTLVGHIKTMRLTESGDDLFRPAATGEDLDQLKLRILMERIEVEASVNQPPGFISCAAHYDELEAINNAKKEAVERVSLGVWWSLGELPIGKADQTTVDRLKSLLPDEINVEIGFIKPVSQTGFVTVCILEQSTNYPFAVLGSAYADSYEDAISRAFMESLQSWSASQWLTAQGGSKPVNWDIGELRRRFKRISEAPEIHASTRATISESQFFNDTRIVTAEHGDAYVVWVYPKNTISTTAQGLAKFALGDVPIKVFTQPNN